LLLAKSSNAFCLRKNISVIIARVGVRRASSKPSLACGCCRSTPALAGIKKVEKFFPKSFDIWQYSVVGKIELASALLLGVVIAFIFRRSQFISRVALINAAILLGTATLAHALTGWILRVDPTRSTGTVPLPEPFAFIASSLIVFLLFMGPKMSGLILGHAVMHFKHWKTDPRGLAFVLVSIYATFITPWIAVVICD
jgi:hypothetical protein